MSRPRSARPPPWRCSRAEHQAARRTAPRAIGARRRTARDQASRRGDRCAGSRPGGTTRGRWGCRPPGGRRRASARPCRPPRPIRGGEVVAEEADGRRPVGGVGGGVRARLDEAPGQRGEVPGNRKRQREQGDREGPPAAQGQRQDRDRNRCVSEPSDVLAEARRNEVRGRAGDEVDDVHPAQHTGRCNAPGEHDPEAAEHARGGELGQREREAPAGGEEPQQHQLDRCREPERGQRQDELRAAWRPREADPPGSPPATRTRRGSPSAQAPSAARSARDALPGVPRARAAPGRCRARTGMRRKARRRPTRPRRTGSTSVTPAPTHARRRPRRPAQQSRCSQPEAA